MNEAQKKYHSELLEEVSKIDVFSRLSNYMKLWIALHSPTIKFIDTKPYYDKVKLINDFGGMDYCLKLKSEYEKIKQDARKEADNAIISKMVKRKTVDLFGRKHIIYELYIGNYISQFELSNELLKRIIFKKKIICIPSKTNNIIEKKEYLLIRFENLFYFALCHILCFFFDKKYKSVNKFSPQISISFYSEKTKEEIKQERENIYSKLISNYPTHIKAIRLIDDYENDSTLKGCGKPIKTIGYVNIFNIKAELENFDLWNNPYNFRLLDFGENWKERFCAERYSLNYFGFYDYYNKQLR